MMSGMRWANGIRIMLEERKYLVFFIASCAVFFTIYIFAWNIVLFRTHYFRADLWTLPNIFLLVSTSVLSALAATLSAYSLSASAAYHRHKYGYFAILPALFASACPSCAPLILSFGSATFAIGMSFAKYGTPLRVAALILLAAVVVHQSSSLGICKVKKKMNS